MKIRKIVLLLFLLLIYINTTVFASYTLEPSEDIPNDNFSNYKTIDDLLKELKEERKLIEQQRLDEINQKKLEKQSENEGETPPPSNKEADKNKPNDSVSNDYIPKLIVRLRGKHSSKYLCSYNFIIRENSNEKELFKEVITDYSRLLKKPSLKVRPGESINFEFSPECKNIKTSLYDPDSKTLKEIKIKRGSITVPDEDKKVVIIVEGKFDNGQIIYAVVLDIRKA